MSQDEFPPESGTHLPDEAGPKTPWSFKVMIVLLTVYLLYRLWQGILWVADKAF